VVRCPLPCALPEVSGWTRTVGQGSCGRRDEARQETEAQGGGKDRDRQRNLTLPSSSVRSKALGVAELSTEEICRRPRQPAASRGGGGGGARRDGAVDLCAPCSLFLSPSVFVVSVWGACGCLPLSLALLSCPLCLLLCFALLCFALLCFALLCFALLCSVLLLCFAHERNGIARARARREGKGRRRRKDTHNNGEEGQREEQTRGGAREGEGVRRLPSAPGNPMSARCRLRFD
jgi:hypothetical protein